MEVESNALPYRFISGRKMNRLNLWSDKDGLREYFEKFRKAYPSYILNSPYHKGHEGNRLFFSIPIEQIERIYFPRRGFQELMSMPKDALDRYLKKVYDFSEMILKSGLSKKDIGITYSTLMGHYDAEISDMNFVIYGKENFWKLMQYLENCRNSRLRWKSDEEWLEFRKRRNRMQIFSEEEFLHSMSRKRSEGFFDDTLFVIFAAEKEEETWFKWGQERYTSLGLAKIRGKVKSNHSSVVRPGCYELSDAIVLETVRQSDSAALETFGQDVGQKRGSMILEGLPITQVVFYSRDYCMLAYPDETIEACGILEEVEQISGSASAKKQYRLVIGYFDAYIDGRREREYIKVVKDDLKKNKQKKVSQKENDDKW